MPDAIPRTPPASSAFRRCLTVIRVWGPALVVMAVIFAFSSIEGEDLTTLPGEVPDKAGHFLGYFLLGAAVLRGTAGARWRGVTAGTVAAAWGICALYGASDEWHQTFVSGRTAAVDDWVADAAGAAAAVAGLWLVATLRRRRARTV